MLDPDMNTVLSQSLLENGSLFHEEIIKMTGSAAIG